MPLERLREAEPGGPAGGTLDDLRMLAASGRHFGAILADPPWPFATWSHIGLAGDRWQGHRAERSREPPYRTMMIEDIAALPVAALARGAIVRFFCGWCRRSCRRGA
jgi:hypothetical protein